MVGPCPSFGSNVDMLAVIFAIPFSLFYIILGAALTALTNLREHFATLPSSSPPHPLPPSASLLYK